VVSITWKCCSTPIYRCLRIASTMGWFKEAVAYDSIKTNDDVELALVDSGHNEKPRKRMSREHYRELKHYALYSVLTAVGLLMQITYLGYKSYLYCLHPGEVLRRPWLIILLLCECVYLVTAAFAAIDHMLPPGSRPDLGLLDTTQRSTPRVDILIPTCKEPTDVPVETIKAALAVDYPAELVKVFVLDDGGDDELRAFCDGVAGRVVYIRREKLKGVPHNFKCGNMNNGLQYSEAEYVVMMDADMILHPSYLRRLLPHIVNSSDVAFVQVPQGFYNLPVGDPLNDSCTMGYDRILANRDTVGTASCVGTGALFRRRCLDEIGGFQPQSITEDTMTAYTLFNRGYESVYLNEKLQIGLTPWTFEGYIKQRTRWGKGAIQQYSASWRACLGKDSQLNFLQKIFYFYHTGYYFVSFVNVLLTAILLTALAFNWKLSVGTETETLALIKYLTLYLVSARLTWIALWLNMPQGLMMRNREESHFWWMTPYFLQMCVEALRDFNATFVFVPTSNIDKDAAAGPQSRLNPNYFALIKQVKWHLGFVVVAMAVVIGRASHAIVSRDCGETFLVLGLSLFLISVSAHMLIPVAFVFFPPNFKPSQRKSLIPFNADGVPQFTPDDCIPKWSWTVLPYELLSCITVVFWAAALVFVILHPSGDVLHSWCKP
jgi:cellulose synthase/poly-beta-1,6-N-acetylglucosamine synthase-like glycosyltransferase